MQLSTFLKVPIGYFFEDFSEYLSNLEKSQGTNININYNFLTKIFNELTIEQKNKLQKNLLDIKQNIHRTG